MINIVPSAAMLRMRMMRMQCAAVRCCAFGDEVEWMDGGI
jgi:hypothetical protein